MWFFIGIVRSTLLYGFVLSVLNGPISVEWITLYALFLAIHILICKLSKDGREASDILTGTVSHDVTAPFLGVKALIQLLLRKYLTNRNESHAAVFLTQGIVEGLWGTILVIYLAITVFQKL